MLWQEEDTKKVQHTTSQTVVDVAFNISCRTLPVDHAYALSQALQQALTWFDAEPQAGLHLIHGAESGNGWYRPEETGDIIYLSRRTKLIVRLPRQRVVDVQILTGLTLDIAGHPLQIGQMTEKPLTKSSVLFARHVIADPEQDEETFLEQIIQQLQAQGIRCRKILCGKTHYFSVPNGTLFTRSLMLADLKAQDSITLQEQGLGEDKKMGCGLFIPHKDIKSVNPDDE
jgi:CRISPR-associated protein Cas6